MARGLVVEKTKRYAVVLTAEGEFRYLTGRRARAAEVGKIIWLAERTVSRWLVAVAASLLILTLAAWQLGLASPAAAYLSVDLGPVVELALDRDGRIVKARGLGPEGQELVRELPLAGEPAQQGLAILLRHAALTRESLPRPVVVGLTVLPGRSGVDIRRVAGWAAGAQAASEGSGEVVVVPVSVLQRGKALVRGDSPARYALSEKITARDRAQATMEERLRELAEKGEITLVPGARRQGGPHPAQGTTQGGSRSGEDDEKPPSPPDTGRGGHPQKETATPPRGGKHGGSPGKG